MMQVNPIDGGSPATQPTRTPTSAAATNAFGLSFDSLLKIILTQLTYQDPLKPMENFEFVSQLAQFSQIQMGQQTNDQLAQLVSAQGGNQATALLGRTVDAALGATLVSGKVVSVSFAGGEPRLTIETANDQTYSDLTLASVTQVRQGE